MDMARVRFKNNVERLTKHNPALAVMGDRDWTNASTNPYIQYMAKKLWLLDYTQRDVDQLTKAVLGYLKILEQRANASPVAPGNRVVKGEVVSVKQGCVHPNCLKHWYMNVREDESRSLIYTPIPQEFMDDVQANVGKAVSFYAYITASARDNTFGFAHKPKLMTMKENQNAS